MSAHLLHASFCLYTAMPIYLVVTDLGYVRIYTAKPKRLKASKAFAKAFQAFVFCPQASKDLGLLRFPKHVPIRVRFEAEP